LAADAAAGPARADDDAVAPPSKVEQRSDTKSNNFYGTVGYYQIHSPSTYVAGFEFNLAFRHAYSDRVAFGPRLRQAYSQPTLSQGYETLFTALAVDMDISLTGTFRQETAEASLDDQRVISYLPQATGGWRCTLSMNQFFINTTKVAAPFSGFGLGFRYDVPSERDLAFTVGASLDRITNSVLMLVPVQIYGGIVHNL
jgi:hypothetical protein